jgi:hypothetical protein
MFSFMSISFYIIKSEFLCLNFDSVGKWVQKYDICHKLIYCAVKNSISKMEVKKAKHRLWPIYNMNLNIIELKSILH